MALKTKSVDRQEVLDLAALSVEGAASDGGTIAIDMTAHRLLDTYPDCEIPFEELRDAIARLAIERGVGVEFGDRSYEQQDDLGSRSREVVAADKGSVAGGKSAMTVSRLDAEHMSSAAEGMAKSGDYLGWTEIELELRDRGYPDAPEWLRDTKLRTRLETICREARIRKVTQP